MRGLNDEIDPNAGLPTITVVQTSARGQALPPKPGLIGISSGQHGISTDIAVMDIAIAEPFSAANMMLLAYPMLIGPATIPSRASTNSIGRNDILAMMPMCDTSDCC